MSGARFPIAVALAGLIASTGLAIATPLSAQGAAPNCAAFNDAVHYRVNPTSLAGLMTSSLAESQGAVDFGFTRDRGTLFRGAVQADSTLSAVHRLYKKSNGDFLFTLKSAEISKLTSAGYVDQGRNFSATATSASCLVPVYRFVRGTTHQYAVSAAARKSYTAAGWRQEGIAFHAAPPTAIAPTADTKFSFAVMPDTQQEVLKANDSRFINRSKWLVANKSALDLRWVASSGDVVNWDPPDHAQYKIAAAAMVPLEQAKIPYTLTIGNHDTQATMSPGGARDPSRTRILQRDTRTFNAYFKASRYTSVGGAYEANKVDNIYTSYTAGGRQWMVIALELWPRKGVVDWAKQVVASHPHHNVIITTHNYTDGAGVIGTSAGYGDTSPQYLYDNLVKQYTNIKFVACGHTGQASQRVDTGVHGNKIISFNQTFHSNTTNPVRLIEVDTTAGTVTSKIHAPATNQVLTTYATTHTGMTYVS